MSVILQDYKFEIICSLWFLFLAYLVIRYIFISEKKPNIDKVLMIIFFVDLATFFPVVFMTDNAYSISSAIIYVLRIFAMEMNFGEFIEEVRKYNSFVLYQWLAAILYSLSPILAGAFILSFIKDKYKSIQISWNISKKMYIFTELNERSLSVAKSIEKKGNKIIFLDSSGEENTKLKEDCHSNGYLLINYSVERVYEKIRKHIFNRISNPKIYKEAIIFFIDNDENTALDKVINFIPNIINNEKQIKTSLFLFSMSSEAEVIVDNYKAEFDNKKINGVTLRLIDSAQIISYQLLENHPLYDMETYLLTKGFNITVIGTGNVGTHITKDVIWCGQTQHTPLRINVIEQKTDKGTHGQAQGKFEYKFPEITPVNYDIHYFYVDVQQKEFDELLNDSLSESNYFVVALDDDETNIMIAHNIRMKYYKKYNKFPVIVAVVSDENKYLAIKDVFEKLKIKTVGNNSEIYSMDSILSNPIYYKAYLFDCAYCKIKGNAINPIKTFLNNRESIIRSNIACAIHIDYKLWDVTGINPIMVKNAPKQLISKFNNMTAEEKQELAEFEHVRWEAFQRSEGLTSPFTKDDFTSEEVLKKAMEAYIKQNHKNYISGIDYEQSKDPSKVKLHQSLFSKQHGCIIDYKYLELLAEMLGKNKDEFTALDKALNNEILNIWLKYVKGNADVQTESDRDK